MLRVNELPSSRNNSQARSLGVVEASRPASASASSGATKRHGSGVMTSSERQIEEQLLQRLRDLKYDHRADIRDRAGLESNFRDKFQALNRVELTDGEFQRLRGEIITPDVFSVAKTL